MLAAGIDGESVLAQTGRQSVATVGKPHAYNNLKKRKVISSHPLPLTRLIAALTLLLS